MASISAPADLTLGLQGKRYAPGFDRREPEMIEAIKRILHAAHKAGKRAALHNGTPEYAAEAVGWGFDFFVTVSNDVRLLAAAADASVRKFRELVQEVAPENKNRYGRLLNAEDFGGGQDPRGWACGPSIGIRRDG
jgi:4-hydroxy-2-oxoheptanedioate aldolase